MHSIHNLIEIGGNSKQNSFIFSFQQKLQVAIIVKLLLILMCSMCIIKAKF